MAEYTKPGKQSQTEVKIEPWGRLPRETTKAYDAFHRYMTLSAGVRSINRAFRIMEGADPTDSSITAPAQWFEWSAKWGWVERAAKYDDQQKAIDRELWEERKRLARERDWEQAERLRQIVDGALASIMDGTSPLIEQFFRRNISQPGTPTIVGADGEIIRHGTPTLMTVALDVNALRGVVMDASKIQRLTVNEPTDNINNLTGIALDDALERALGQWALENLPNSGEASPVAENVNPGETIPGQDEADEDE